MENEKKQMLDSEQLGRAIQLACDRRIGVLDGGFLCQSVSVLNPQKPVCAPESASVREALALLRAKRMGCILITDSAGKLSGIFSERDVVLKIDLENAAQLGLPISELMTKDPICGSFETTMAFALNLMSQGGFRHIPIVDKEHKPVGMISVKDVVDRIVATFVEDVMSFEVPEV